MQTQELISSAQRANLDAVFGLAGKMADGVGKLVELNARFTRTTLEGAWEIAQNAIEKPQDWMTIQGSMTTPMAEQVRSYSQEFLGIVSAAQAEMLKAAQEEGDAYVLGVRSLVEGATKNVPGGSEAAVAALNSAIAAANTFYQALGRTGQQAVEVARSSFDAAAAAAERNARHAVEQERQAAKR